MSDQETTPATPRCPRCSAALFAGKVGHLDALGCGGCGGIWLDNVGTTAILQRCDLDAEKLARLVDGNAAKREMRSPFEAAKGPCPFCAQALQVVDHQSQHGAARLGDRRTRLGEQMAQVIAALLRDQDGASPAWSAWVSPQRFSTSR